MNAPPVDMKVKIWSPSVPCKIPDNIVSSQFTSSRAFVPSYEKEKRPCIEQLLTNEYQRIWWQEKEQWEKRNDAKKISKKLLQRAVIRRKPMTAPVVDKPKKPRKPRIKKEPKDSVEKGKESPRKKPEKVEKAKVTIKDKKTVKRTEAKDKTTDKETVKKKEDNEVTVCE